MAERKVNPELLAGLENSFFGDMLSVTPEEIEYFFKTYVCLPPHEHDTIIGKLLPFEIAMLVAAYKKREEAIAHNQQLLKGLTKETVIKFGYANKMYETLEFLVFRNVASRVAQYPSNIVIRTDGTIVDETPAPGGVCPKCNVVHES